MQKQVFGKSVLEIKTQAKNVLNLLKSFEKSQGLKLSKGFAVHISMTVTEIRPFFPTAFLDCDYIGCYQENMSKLII